VRYFIFAGGTRFFGDTSSISILDHGGGSVNEGGKKGMLASFGAEMAESVGNRRGGGAVSPWREGLPTLGIDTRAEV
jgi:hypothetical protein